MTWAWLIKRSQMGSHAWLLKLFSLLREPLLEKCCVSTRPLSSHTVRRKVPWAWVRIGVTHCCCWRELRPRDLPDSSGGRRRRPAGAGPGGRPTGAAQDAIFQWLRRGLADASIHQPNIEFLLLVSSLRAASAWGWLLQRVFCVGSGVRCLRTIARSSDPASKKREDTWAEGQREQACPGWRFLLLSPAPSLL